MCVLIVEDELLIRMNLAMVFEDAGHEVMCAATGAEAVEMAQHHPQKLSAVVTDFHMPGTLTGADVVATLRRDYPTIPMVIATANVAAVSQEFQKVHGVRVFGKPYDIDALASSLGKDLAAP